MLRFAFEVIQFSFLFQLYNVQLSNLVQTAFKSAYSGVINKSKLGRSTLTPLLSEST